MTAGWRSHLASSPTKVGRYPGSLVLAWMKVSGSPACAGTSARRPRRLSSRTRPRGPRSPMGPVAAISVTGRDGERDRRIETMRDRTAKADRAVEQAGIAGPGGAAGRRRHRGASHGNGGGDALARFLARIGGRERSRPRIWVCTPFTWFCTPLTWFCRPKIAAGLTLPPPPLPVFVGCSQARRACPERGFELADIDRVGRVDARRHIGDAPLGARHADRDRVRQIRDRSLAKRHGTCRRCHRALADGGRAGEIRLRALAEGEGIRGIRQRARTDRGRAGLAGRRRAGLGAGAERRGGRIGEVFVNKPPAALPAPKAELLVPVATLCEPTAVAMAAFAVAAKPTAVASVWPEAVVPAWALVPMAVVFPLAKLDAILEIGGSVPGAGIGADCEALGAGRHGVGANRSGRIAKGEAAMRRPPWRKRRPPLRHCRRPWCHDFRRTLRSDRRGPTLVDGRSKAGSACDRIRSDSRRFRIPRITRTA